MEGKIANFRMSRTRMRGNYMVVLVNGVNNKEKAASLVGKTAVWTSPEKKEIKGKVTAAHGSNGAVRVLFEKGMPGQCLTEKVKIE